MTDDFAVFEKVRADAQLGDEMERFKKSLPYAYLMACADREAAEATSALIDADPLDTKMISHLQFDVRRARSLRAWIEGAIRRGLIARDNMAGGDEE